MSVPARQLIHRPLHRLPSLAGAMLLAVLIPLACILSCHTQAPQRAERPASHAQHGGAHDRDALAANQADAGGIAPAGHDHRLCGMHAADAVLLYPHALYDLVPLAAPGLAFVLAILGLASARPPLRPTNAAYAPLTPPPQLALG
jgi:hypothetical protein